MLSKDKSGLEAVIPDYIKQIALEVNDTIK